MIETFPDLDAQALAAATAASHALSEGLAARADQGGVADL
jgi:hypothetical protein